MSQHRSRSNPRNSPAAGPGAAPWTVVLQPTPALPYVHAGDAPVMYPISNTYHSSPNGMNIPSHHTSRGMNYGGGLMIPSSSAYPSSSASPSTPVPIPRSSPARVNSGGHFEDRYVDPAYYGSQLAPSPGEVMAANIAAGRMAGMTSQMPRASAQPTHTSASSTTSSRSTSASSTRTASTLTNSVSAGSSSGHAPKKFYICNDDASPSCASSYA